MTGPEVAIIVLVGVSLLLQAIGGWFAFVAYLDENIVRAGNKDASHRLNGALLSPRPCVSGRGARCARAVADGFVTRHSDAGQRVNY